MISRYIYILDIKRLNLNWELNPSVYSFLFNKVLTVFHKIVIGNYVPDAFDKCLWDKGDNSDILGDTCNGPTMKTIISKIINSSTDYNSFFLKEYYFNCSPSPPPKKNKNNKRKF